MKDESKRREYDRIYPSLRGRRTSASNTHTSFPTSASTPQQESLSDAIQLAAILKSKQEREERWRIKRNGFDSSIFEHRRGIARLEQEIKILESIFAAEAAAEAQKNSWGTWLLSPLYKKVEDSDEVKERKDRERQERRVQKDMKERRLISSKEALAAEEARLKQAKEEIDAADLCDTNKIRNIYARTRARETREREEREWRERQRQEKERQERQERERAEAERNLRQQRGADEAFRRQLAQAYARAAAAAEQRRREASASICQHEGWWPKVQGRASCPDCHDRWTYLLQCPSCEKKACPKCQAAIRRRRPRAAAGASRRGASGPDFGYDFDDW